MDDALGDLGVRSDDRGRWARLTSFVTLSGSELAFTGELVRDVAYEGLPFARRRELHGRVADVLRCTVGDDRPTTLDGDDLALVAWHLEQAGRWSQAWPVAVAAGDAARRAYANTDAVDAYRRALSAAAHLPDLPTDELADVAERCGDTCEVAALYDEASRAFATARRAATDPITHLRLLRKQGVVEERTGRYTQALRWYGRALRQAETMDGADARACVAELHIAYAGVRYRQGRLRQCARHARIAAELASPIDDLTNLAHAYYLLDAVHTDLGEEQQAAPYRHRALPVFEQTGDLIGQANTLNNLGINAFIAGELGTALQLYERSRTARLTAGDVVGAATADNNIAEILIEQDQLDEAEELLRRARRVWRGARYPIGVALATSNLGVVAARRGHTSNARVLLVEALQSFERLGATGQAEATASHLAQLDTEPAVTH